VPEEMQDRHFNCLAGPYIKKKELEEKVKGEKKLLTRSSRVGGMKRDGIRSR